MRVLATAPSGRLAALSCDFRGGAIADSRIRGCGGFDGQLLLSSWVVWTPACRGWLDFMACSPCGV